MPVLGTDIASSVVAACQAASEEIARGLSRALNVPMTVTVGKAGVYDLAAAAASSLPLDDGVFALDTPGLLLILAVDRAAALLFIPEEGGLLQNRHRSSDGSAHGGMASLAQELSRLVLPTEFEVGETAAVAVDKFSQALARGGVAAGAAAVDLRITSDDGRNSTMLMVWPAPRADQLLALAETRAVVPSATERSESTAAASIKRLDELPTYTKSLLHIRVPVTVKLASTKQPVSRILDLGPGSIIQFAKSCEEMLDLEVGGHAVAQGEAVKVGDKFGIRLTQIVPPPERFHELR